MAAAVDGTILIDSHIITDGLNSDIAAVENRLRKIAKNARSSGRNTAAGSVETQERDKLLKRLEATETEKKRLEQRLARIDYQKAKYIAKGGSEDSQAFKGYEFDAENTLDAIAATKGQINDLLAELDALKASEADASKKASENEKERKKITDRLKESIEELAQKAEKAWEKMKNLDSGSKSTERSSKGLFRAVMKYGLGIRSVYILFRKLRQAITEGFKNLAQVDNQTNESISTLKSSLSQLKNSFAAAFAPVLNAVAPILNKLIRMLVTAANYVGMFFAALSGASSYRPAIYAYEDYADSLNNAAGAAADAAKNLSGLDEMNVWQEKSGGGGGGTSPADMFGDEEAIPNSVANIAEKVKSIFMAVYNAVAPVLKDLWNLLVFEADDVLFNWSNLSSEDILEKIVAGLGLVLGAIAGFSITHSLTGLVIGAVVGLAITLLLDGVVFDDDGKISKAEILKLLVGALAGIAGAVIGFKIGGAKGAAIGAVIGMLLTVLIQRIEFSSDPVKNTNIKNQLQTALVTLSAGFLGFKIGGGLGAVIGVSVGLVISALSWEETSAYALTETQQQLVESVDAITEAYKNVSKELETNTNLVVENYDRTADLWRELQTLCDENGNLTAGYEDRVDFILCELNDALDTEYSRNGDIITQYQEMQAEIDNLIAKKRNEALLSNWGPDYDAAIAARTENLEKLKSLEKELDDAWNTYASLYSPDPTDGDSNAKAEEYYDNVYKPLEDKYNALTEATLGYYQIIGRYEAAEAAMLAGDYDTATRILESYSQYRWMNMEKNHEYSQQELAELKSALDSAAWYAAWYKQQFEAGMEGFTKDGLTEASSAAAELAEIWHDAGADAKEYAAFYKQQFEQGIEGFTAKGLFEAKVAAGELEKTWTDAAGEAEAYAAWYKECFENGLAGFTKEGLAEAEQFAANMHTTLSDAASDAKTDGNNIALGLAEGIKEKAQAAIRAAKELAQGVLNPLKNIPQIASPAKVPRGYGRYISEGYALGITDEIGAAEEAATRVANSALSGMMTTFSGTKLPFSRIASGSIIPTAAALGAGSSDDTDLLGILREALAEFFGTKTSRSTSITAKVNSRTLFDVMIEEGRQRMRANGRNPFTEMAML